MADSNSSNVSARRELAQDDPFAELTRIMGHDPRVAAPKPQTSEVAADDLALELENELMGDLMPGDDTAEGPETGGALPAEAAPWNGAANETAAQKEADLHAMNGAQYQPLEPQAENAADEDALEDALDDAFASADDLASFESAVRAEDEPHDMPAEFFGSGANTFELREDDLAPLDADFAEMADEAAQPKEPDSDWLDDLHAQPEAAEPAPEQGFAEAVEAPPVPQEERWEASEVQWAAGAASWQPLQENAEAENTQEWASDEGDQLWPEEDAADHAPSDPSRAAFSPPPEVETVDVPESTVAVADNLDIPDVPYREEVRSARALDEVEEMLAGAFGEADEAPEQPGEAWTSSRSSAEPAGWERHEEGAEEELTAGLAAAMAVEQAELRHVDERADYNFSDEDWNAAFDESEQLAPSPGVEPPARADSRFGSRTVAAAAVIGGIALLGGVAVFALTFGGGEPAGPVVVQADDSPVKVKPENPGGTTIPNQDSQVYKRVAGEEADAQPEQTRLVSRMEEPIDLPAPIEEVSAQADEMPAAEDAPAEAAKIEERLASVIEDSAPDEGEPVTLAPRRVRSFVVRPDGSMVPNDLPEPEVPAETAAASVGDQPSTTAGETPAPTDTGAQAAAIQASGTDASADTAQAPGTEEEAGTQPTLSETETAGDTAETEVAAVMPSQGPIPPSRPATIPSAQPQQQAEAPAPAAGTQAPEQVAAAQPQPAQPQATPSAAASDWSVQIASQPTLDGAQRSYQELAQRYGSMLQGRGVNIVKAEIDGRGTYYRVRVPSVSKDEAIQLCSQLKSAGGSCFVSK